jgi:hypothetical protein
MIYHVGYLPRDREHDDKLHQRAHRLLREAEASRVHLVQRRRGDFRYEYHAVKPAEKDWWTANAGG